MPWRLSVLVRKDSLLIFLFVWLVTGIFINVNDQRAFNLQQMGIDAIVSHQTFTLGHSDLPILKPLGDTFYTDKGILPAKQPGQFALGAVPYFFLKSIGISYEFDYNLTASLVTWFSTSLISALALMLIYELLKLWGIRRRSALWSVLTLGVGCHWIVYAGIAHHDIVATSCLTIALYFVEYNMIKHKGRHGLAALLAGLFAGLTIFASMLPALIVMVFGLYILTYAKIKQTLYSGLGFLLGIAPLFLYNYNYFGNPFTQANVAGNYTDTFFTINYEQFSHHLNAYLGYGGLSIWKYAPSIVLGFLALALLPKKFWRIKLFIYLSCFLHMFYLVNIETLGTCQYGPRYLLPLLPLCVLGIAVLVDKYNGKYPFSLGLLLGAILLHSTASSLIGAWGGAMQCDLQNFMMWRYLVEHNKLNFSSLLLLQWLAPLLFGLSLYTWYLMRGTALSYKPRYRLPSYHHC